MKIQLKSSLQWLYLCAVGHPESAGNNTLGHRAAIGGLNSNSIRLELTLEGYKSRVRQVSRQRVLFGWNLRTSNELIIRVVTRGRGNFSVCYKQFSWKLVDMDESGDYDEDDTSIDDSFRLSKPQWHVGVLSLWNYILMQQVPFGRRLTSSPFVVYCQAQEKIPIFAPFILCYCLLRMMSSRKNQELPQTIIH